MTYDIPEPIHDPQDTPPSGMYRVPDIQAQGLQDQNTFAPDDTQPIQAVASHGSGLIGAMLYGLAFLITAGAAVYYLRAQSTVNGSPVAVNPATAAISTVQSVIIEASPVQPTEMPEISTIPITAPVQADPVRVLPDQVAPVDVAAELLLQPAFNAAPGNALYRQQNPFTIAPVRPRSGVIQYTIQQGDTLDKIAARFGISTDTVVWNNDGIYVNRLFPGDRLTILPESGVLHKTIGEETVQSIADKYKVSAYAVIDSEYNRLQYAKPTTILPSDFAVVVPGGTSDKKAVFWDPGTKVTTQTGAGGKVQQVVSFGSGQSGSCGNSGSGGGTGGFILPLSAGSYIVTRAFSASHNGVDMATSAGRTVFAADGGTVIFAGWSSFGYGNAIVLNHGASFTLYGHLSAISAQCGQQVSQGQPIGAVGSTGQSSGPHLHFEIRPAANSYYPSNPRDFMGF